MFWTGESIATSLETGERNLLLSHNTLSNPSMPVCSTFRNPTTSYKFMLLGKLNLIDTREAKTFFFQTDCMVRTRGM